MADLAGLTVAELADGICLRAGRVAAGQAELLVWIGEFDRREGWAEPGMLSCAHWLSWRIGLGPGAAREQVRVARRLPELPQVAAAFGDGRLSCSCVRAITRVAEPGDGVDWVRLGRQSSAAQLERLVRGMRRAKLVAESAADPEQAAWKVRTRKRYDTDGNLVITITTRAEYAPLVEAGLDARRAELQRELDAQQAPEPEPVRVTPTVTPVAVPDVPAGTSPGSGGRAVAADPGAPVDGWPAGTTTGQVREAIAAFTRLWVTTPARPTRDELAAAPQGPATAPLRAPSPAGVPAGTPDRPVATDGDALLAWAQDQLLTERADRPALARTLPGPDRLRPVTDADLRRHDLGRTTRLVTPALRTLLGTLDGERCRFPGCTRHRALHAHHVRYWRYGGPTDLANLVLVCARHHTLIHTPIHTPNHTQGFTLVLHPDRQLSVTTADGTALHHHPAQPWADPTDLARDTGQHVTATTLPPEHTDHRLQLGYAVTVLLAQAA